MLLSVDVHKILFIIGIAKKLKIPLEKKRFCHRYVALLTVLLSVGIHKMLFIIGIAKKLKIPLEVF